MLCKSLRFSIVCGLSLSLLAGCSGSRGGEDSSPVIETPVLGPVSVGSTQDINFDLEAPTTPNFDDIASQLEVPSYVDVGGETYQEDPATQEPIGDPIPLETEAPPIEVEGGLPDMPDDIILGEMEDTGGGEAEEEEEEPLITTPTEDTKLPNTGIFTEED